MKGHLQQVIALLFEAATSAQIGWSREKLVSANSNKLAPTTSVCSLACSQATVLLLLRPVCLRRVLAEHWQTWPAKCNRQPLVGALNAAAAVAAAANDKCNVFGGSAGVFNDRP